MADPTSPGARELLAALRRLTRAELDSLSTRYAELAAMFTAGGWERIAALHDVVASLREIGMSVRAIASATGQGRETIRKEIAGDHKWSPELGARNEAARADLDLRALLDREGDR